MKTFLLYFAYAVCLVSSSLVLKAQSPEWEWVKTPTGKRTSFCFGNTTDNNGNAYVTGVFFGESITFGEVTLTNSTGGNSGEMFLVKYSPIGEVLWAKNCSGPIAERGISVSTDNAGNVYVAGLFAYSISFNSGDSLITLETPAQDGYADIFIVKYNADGNVIWVRSVVGTNNEEPVEIITDKNNNFYLAGLSYSPSISFGNISLSAYEPDGTISGTDFIVKYDTDGHALWVRSFGGGGDEKICSIKTDKNGNVYMLGLFSASSIEFENAALSNDNNAKVDMFILKYDTDGNFLWIRSPESSDSKYGTGMTIDEKGNIYAAGVFYGPNLTFDPMASNPITVQNTESDNSTGIYLGDIFTVKYDTNGKLEWVNSVSGAGEDIPTNITIDKDANIYITGDFQSSKLDFKTAILNTTDPNYYRDRFIVRYNSSGQAQWVKALGIKKIYEQVNFSADRSGNLYLAGHTLDTIVTFGKITIKAVSENVFLAKLNSVVTSISEESNSVTSNIFPNPTASQFHITNLEPGSWTIAIYTFDGRSVFKKELTEADAMIDLSGRAKGAYVYRLLKDGEVFKSGKLVLE